MYHISANGKIGAKGIFLQARPTNLDDAGRVSHAHDCVIFFPKASNHRIRYTQNEKAYYKFLIWASV